MCDDRTVRRFESAQPGAAGVTGESLRFNNCGAFTWFLCCKLQSSIKSGISSAGGEIGIFLLGRTCQEWLKIAKEVLIKARLHKE